MTTIELDERLNPKNWTRRTLITHLDNPNAGECHGNYYYGSDTTKRSMVDSHREKHEREIARAARLRDPRGHHRLSAHHVRLPSGRGQFRHRR